MSEKRYDARAILEPSDLKKYSSGGMRDPRFEVENPAVKKTMNEIAGKIGGALDAGWGFLLMLFSYDDTKVEGGGLFYISSADRPDVLKMVDKWMRMQKSSDSLRAQEINPDDPTTRAVHDHWHKIVALVMMRMAQQQGIDPLQLRVNFKGPDITAFAELCGGRAAVGVQDDADGLTLFLADEDEARAKVKAGDATLGQPGQSPLGDSDV